MGSLGGVEKKCKDMTNLRHPNGVQGIFSLFSTSCAEKTVRLVYKSIGSSGHYPEKEVDMELPRHVEPLPQL